MLCLEAGKNVLCEKAFTVNAAQTKILIETAKSKKLFLMEAVWTRYFPLSISVRKMIENGEIGAVHRVQADLSFNETIDGPWGPEHRMFNMDLAGGALLDCTICPMCFPDLKGAWTLLLTSEMGSGHLLPDLGFPMPLPHVARGST